MDVNNNLQQFNDAKFVVVNSKLWGINLPFLKI